ncbi:MAG: type IV secretion protein Rhs [Acinetobacter sp.]|nr:type IV secretion protein Rhs [Acinetobacter sp.]
MKQQVKTFLSSWWVTRRHLTIGERQLAHSVFRHHLVLDGIEIRTHRAMRKGYALSVGGHVYFHPQDVCDDFSQQSLELQAWFIHELVHVWQAQQGMAVLWRALFNRRYRYHLQVGKSFYDYGIEQQAQIVQDYFLKKQRGQACQAYQHCIPFLNEV